MIGIVFKETEKWGREIETKSEFFFLFTIKIVAADNPTKTPPNVDSTGVKDIFYSFIFYFFKSIYIYL